MSDISISCYRPEFVGEEGQAGSVFQWGWRKVLSYFLTLHFCCRFYFSLTDEIALFHKHLLRKRRWPYSSESFLSAVFPLKLSANVIKRHKGELTGCTVILEEPRICIPNAAGKAGGETVGGFSPISNACRLRQEQQVNKANVKKQHSAKDPTDLWCCCDKVEFCWTGFHGTNHAEVVQCTVLSSMCVSVPFSYSSCMSPASAFGFSGTSASNRQPQKPERIWGDTDHQGNEARAGNACAEMRVENLHSPPQRDPSVCLRDSTAGAPAAPQGSATSSFLLPCWFCLVLPLLNSPAVLPVCSSSLVSFCFLLIPAHNYSLFLWCSCSTHNLDTCLIFLPWFCSTLLTQPYSSSVDIASIYWQVFF